MELGKPLLLQIGAHPKLKHCTHYISVEATAKGLIPYSQVES